MNKINKILNFEVKQIGPEEDRVLRFVGSDETPDRDNDIIEVAGWKLEDYLKNPVFMWAHKYDEPPIGKAINVMTDMSAKSLIFDIKFATADEYPFADTIYKLYKGGYLNATSVGFKGIKFKARDDESVLEKPEWQRGRRYMEQSLMELSGCPVPCNPNALMEVRSKGFVAEDIDKIFTEEAEPLKEVGLLVDTETNELFICEDGQKTAKIKTIMAPSGEEPEQYKSFTPDFLLNQKSGASLSSKNKKMLDEIHKQLAGCGDTLRKFIDSAGTMEDEPPEGMPPDPMMTATRTAPAGEEKTLADYIISQHQALEEIKTQVLFLSQKLSETDQKKEASEDEINLDAIEFVPTEKNAASDELEIEPGELKELIGNLLDERLKNFEGGK